MVSNMFELDSALVESITYGMENQEQLHVLDAETLRVIAADQVDPSVPEDSGRYVPLPQWRPVDGFRMMEGFVSGLRNPLFREELRCILQSGRGVFRQFKDALRERPDMERLWFSWKQREMRHRIHDWYNGLREVWGLSPLAWDDRPETDTSDLVLWDFTIGRAEPGPELEILDREFFDEAHGGLLPGERDLLFLRLRTGLPSLAGGERRMIEARSAGGELAGFLWYEKGKSHAELVQLGVVPEFRGLGIARTLLARMRRELAEDVRNSSCCLSLWASVPPGAEFLEKHLKGATGERMLSLVRDVLVPD